MSILKTIIKKIYYYIFASLAHEKFAKKIGVNMGQNVYIYGNPINMFSTEPWCITLGNNVHITKEVLFITHDGGTLLFRNIIPDLEITAPIIVGDNVYIGVRSIIMPGVRIGNNCIIAAGSVVTKNIPDNCVYGGIPARFLKTTQEYFEKIQKESLHLGHLKNEEKDSALKKYFNFKEK